MKKTQMILMSVMAAGLLLASGCAGPSASVQDEEKEGLGYTFNAKALLQKGDKLFEEKQYIEAGQEYRNFLDLHPAHESASYVQYRIGLCFFNQIQTVDRDMDPLYKSLEAFQTLLAVYPGAPNAADAEAKIGIIRNKLAEREFYVGRFYLHKKAYPAAIERFNTVLREYPDAPVAEKSLYHLGLAYEGFGEPHQAVESLKNFLDRYPGSPYRMDAAEVLSHLKGTESPL